MSKPSPQAHDVIVVGAGICGVVFLKYARERGLDCVVLEKQDHVGGLWSWLPAWQDIQNRRQDFAINGVPLEGVEQPDIRRHVQQWVEHYHLAPFIELGCEVTSVSRDDGLWNVQTSRGALQAKHLVAASGVQNEPWIPEIERSESAVVETHSARLHQPEELRGKRVTVVGGGASGWDLLDLAIENDAEEIHWVYRSMRWFMPTTKTKQNSWPNLRELGIVQTFKRSTAGVTRFLRWLLRKRFDAFELEALEPTERFDIRKHQLIPGRRRMIENLDAITRHRDEIRSLRGREVVLRSGERFETDVVLWGTGYRMNLRYLSLPEYEGIERLDGLLPKLGSLVRSVDYPSLFFIGMSLTESTSATPFFAAIEAKSIVAHILGECEIPKTQTPHLVAYWDLHGHFARFDRANYPKLWWRIKYFVLACWYALFRNKSVRV